MEFRQSFIVLILVTLSASSVTSVQITVTPASLRLTLGQTLTIRCQETITAADASLTSLGLYKDMRSPGTATEDFQSLREYNLVAGNPNRYVGKWGPAATGDLQNRLNITETLTDTNFKSGSVEFVLPEVKCEEAAAFKCRSASDVVTLSETKNISIEGVTTLTDLTGALECDPLSQDTQTCDNCHNFDDPNGPKPKYAAMNAELMLTCTADVDSSIQNAFRWYKKTINDQVQQPINENITDNSNQPSPGSCTYVGRSTLKYFPTSADTELRIYCEVGNQQLESQSRELLICVQGLTYTQTPAGPGGSGPQSAGLGGGPIAGIVIGVIAVIVLVVVLVYFLWYRRRDGGESYSTREADGRSAPPPTSKKTEMHENSMYDTTGDAHRNNHAPKSRPEREPLHYAELDLVRGGRPLDSDNEPTIDRVRRTGQATPYAEIQLPL